MAICMRIKDMCNLNKDVIDFFVVRKIAMLDNFVEKINENLRKCD